MSIRSRLKTDVDDFVAGLNGDVVAGLNGAGVVTKRQGSPLTLNDRTTSSLDRLASLVSNLSRPIVFGFVLARPGVPFLPWGDLRAIAITVAVAAVAFSGRLDKERRWLQLAAALATVAGIEVITRSALAPTSILAVGSLLIALMALLRAYPALYATLPLGVVVGGGMAAFGNTTRSGELLLSGLPWTAQGAGHELLLCTAMLGLGGLLHFGNSQMTRQEERALAAEASRDRAVSDERARIARELHDVVSHHVTAMTLQAEAAIATGDSAALPAVSASGREALAELRRMLGVLRHPTNGRLSDDQRSVALTPQPDLSRLEQLAARASTSLNVDIVRTGDVVPLASGVELCAYRIVQEAVTNVGKHGDATHATVTLAYEPAMLTVTVRDDGRPLPSLRLDGPGHGLVGMQERVALLEGELETGPADGGGFRVVARLPLEG